MTESLLLFSDLHLRPESEETCFQVLDGVKKVALDNKIHHVAFLGDFFHLRYAVPVTLNNRVASWVKEMRNAGISLRMLAGNHDQVSETGENALEIFEEWGAQIISVPTIDEWGAWMPYRKHPEEVAKNLKALSSQKVLFGHLPVVGAMMNNLMKCEEGLTIESFAPFEKVLLGHYHKQQSFLDGKITYIGSPWQTRADEYNQPKGFAVWTPGGMVHVCGTKCGCIDGDAPNMEPSVGTLDRIQMVYGKRYFRFSGKTAQDVWDQASNVILGSGDSVVLDVANKAELAKAMNGYSKDALPGVSIVPITPDVATPQPRFGLHAGSTLSEYAQAYVQDKAPTPDDRAPLLDLWKELIT